MELGLPKGFTIGGLVRDGRGMTVGGQTQIQAGDHVVVVCMNEKVSQVEKLFKS
jgi:trk system potassium uptake protein TrkA